MSQNERPVFEEEVRFRAGDFFYRIDLVARTSGGTVAFECNQVEESKLKQLRPFFDTVVHLTPEDAIEYLLAELEGIWPLLHAQREIAEHDWRCRKGSS